MSLNCPQTGFHAEIEFLTKPFYGGKRNRITAEIYSPNEKKSFMSVSGEWSGLMEAKYNDGAKTKPEVFVDVTEIPIFHKNVRPISEQEEFESRRIWKEVTAGLRYVKSAFVVIDLILILFFRLNDIDRATNAKCLVEQKQRDEAKTRKEDGSSWVTRVNYKNLKFPAIIIIMFFQYFNSAGDNWEYKNSLSQRRIYTKSKEATQ